MKNNEVTLKLPTDFVEDIISKSCNEGLANAIMHSNADLTIILKGVLGFMHKPKFDIGEQAICNKTIWDYASQESKDKDESRTREIGPCKVIGHNPYSNLYYIEYTWCGKSSNQTRYTDVEESDFEYILPADM